MSIDASFVGPISSRACISFAFSAYEHRPRFKFEQVSTFSIPMIRATQTACSLPLTNAGQQAWLGKTNVSATTSSSTKGNATAEDQNSPGPIRPDSAASVPACIERCRTSLQNSASFGGRADD
jgi:hypothetical protein